MNYPENIKKLKELLSHSRICMLSTYTNSEGIHTRPMAFQQLEDDGAIWFFTNEYSPKMEEISVNHEVSISFSNESQSNYVVLKGQARLSKDKAKMEELFNPMVKVWFPEGLDDPKMALINVEVVSAEYWDNTSSTMVMLFHVAKSLVTGEMYDEGEHGKINL